MDIKGGKKISPKILRVAFYVFIVLVLVAAVLWKRSAILSSRAGEIISVFNEQARFGIPVNAQRISLSDFSVFTRVTATPSKEGDLDAYVDNASRDGFKAGQRFRSIDPESDIKGEVIYVSGNQNITNYLYLIKLKASRPMTSPKDFYALEVETSALRNVIKMPTDAIFDEAGGSYVWTIRDGMAKKMKVKRGFKGDTYTVIKEGLRPGDLVVTAGSGIREGGRLRTFKCENCD